MWTMLVIVAVVAMLACRRRPNAVWGGATVGAIVGLVIAASSSSGFQWSTVGKVLVVGALVGLGAELLGMLSDQVKKAVKS